MTVAEPQTAGGAGQAVSTDTRSTGPGRLVLGLALSVLSAVMLFVMCDGHGNLWPLVIVCLLYTSPSPRD